MTAPWDGVGAFEGPEKTLIICFRTSKLAERSLRRIPRESWEVALKAARCEIISSVESSAVIPSASLGQKKGVRAKTHGLTGYLLSESSLFLSDSTLWLKTCGRTTPLEAMEPILDLATPSWRTKCPEQYLKYVVFTRLGYMFPDDQIGPHASWEKEVGHLGQHFHGDAFVLGSKTNDTYHVYAASYPSRGEVFDLSSTQVSLTNLDPAESLVRFVGTHSTDKTPLQSRWKQLHGDEPRSLAGYSKVRFDESFFEPIGYSANAVFSERFTTIHATPQPACSYVSVETSMPLTTEAKQRFTVGAAGMCRADTLSLTEFVLSTSLFSGGDPPEIPGFKVLQSSRTIGRHYACALHRYRRDALVAPSPSLACSTAPSSLPFVALGEPSDVGALQLLPSSTIVEVGDLTEAPVHAAALFVEAQSGSRFGVEKDIPVALLDLGAVRRQAEVWRRHLPRVEPFYAVKCNSNPALLETLWRIWRQWGKGGFDCASPAEMAAVANLEGFIPARDVIFANPCKQISALKFAKAMDVKRVVFDNETELAKIKEHYTDAELLLRVQTDDSLAQCPLSNKFGATVQDCGALLSRASALGLRVVGVSFHVGSGCSEVGAFRSALRRARAVFDVAEQLACAPLTLLDIGGGFPGWDEAGEATFVDHADDIGALLEELFPPSVRVIAEPGRFFAATSQAMLTSVIAVAGTDEHPRYYLNDGVYGSFNCLIYDHATLPEPVVLREGKRVGAADAEATAQSTVFGPTCDGFDMLAKAMPLPRLAVGDQLVFPNMGAYTSAASTSFNGFAPAPVFVYESKLAATMQR